MNGNHYLGRLGLPTASMLALLILCFQQEGARAADSGSLAALYDRLAPSVVAINCKKQNGERTMGYYGTGVVISPEGRILSNLTVIPKGAEDIKITFTDGHIEPATWITCDEGTETVLVKLTKPGKNLPHMPLADSAGCEVGDPVYTWGNPHDTIRVDGGVSLSLGRITGLITIASRDDQSHYIGPVIETDAAVNPGSDGGPLTDSRGRLIGMQSLAFADRSWLGLAIPTAEMLKAIPELKKEKLYRPAGKQGTAFARERNFHKRAKEIADAVVGVWVKRQEDGQTIPTNWAEWKPSKVRAVNRLERARYERGTLIGCGTGFLISADGMLVTAATNLLAKKEGKGAFEGVYVFTADGKRQEAEILGQDNQRDLAVLKLKGRQSGLPYIDLSDSGSDLPIGGHLALIGRSQAPGNWGLFLGSVSAVLRHRHYYVQTSARINYGNAGGPVIDAEGRLLGMANLMTPQARWRQNCGVGFFYKASLLVEDVPKLAAGKKLAPIKRPVIGVRFAHTTSEDGALIDAVVPDKPAAKAGLQKGDIVIGWNDEVIDSFITLAALIELAGIGAEAKIVVMRGDEEVTVTLTIAGEELVRQNQSNTNNGQDGDKAKQEAETKRNKEKTKKKNKKKDKKGSKKNVHSSIQSAGRSQSAMQLVGDDFVSFASFASFAGFASFVSEGAH